jgi:hypothetical protein
MSHQCVCVEGHAGQYCDIPIVGFVARPTSEPTPANPAVSDVFGTDSCKINCGLHGVCVGGGCSCVDGWAGVGCTISVPEVAAHITYGSTADFLSIMTLQKRAIVAAPTATTTTPTASKVAVSTSKTAKLALMESDSHSIETTEEDSPQPKLHRNTAILAAQKETLQYSPDGRPTILTDPAVTKYENGQVTQSNAQVTSSSGTYVMSMNPYLMSFLCFLSGVFITIALKCLLDKRSQEKRKMKKMEELLQPAS